MDQGRSHAQLLQFDSEVKKTCRSSNSADLALSIFLRRPFLRPLRVIPLLRNMTSTLPPLPTVIGTDPSSTVLDSFRTSIAKRVSEALPLTLEQAYSGVDYGKKGVDFTVALPRFRLPGKVDEIAAKVINKVSSYNPFSSGV